MLDPGIRLLEQHVNWITHNTLTVMFYEDEYNNHQLCSICWFLISKIIWHLVVTLYWKKNFNHNLILKSFQKCVRNKNPWIWNCHFYNSIIFTIINSQIKWVIATNLQAKLPVSNHISSQPLSSFKLWLKTKISL